MDPDEGQDDDHHSTPNCCYVCDEIEDGHHHHHHHDTRLLPRAATRGVETESSKARHDGGEVAGMTRTTGTGKRHNTTPPWVIYIGLINVIYVYTPADVD